MAIYHVERTVSGGQHIENGVRFMIVEADSADIAKDIALAQAEAIPFWPAAADIVATDESTLTAADMTGFVYTVKIKDPVSNAVLYTFTHTGATGEDNDDHVGTELAATINGSAVSAAIAQDDAVFVDDTADANDIGTADVAILPATPVATEDHFYIGMPATFADVTLETTTAAAGTYTLVWEYWDGAMWSALADVAGDDQLAATGHQFVSWTVPEDWEASSVDSVGPFFYVRVAVSVDTSFSAVPVATRIRAGKTLTASFASGTLVVSTGAVDDLGDHTLTVDIVPPGGEGSMTTLYDTVVHRGAASADLSFDLVSLTLVPTVFRKLKV
jgi:hypothetical protein